MIVTTHADSGGRRDDGRPASDVAVIEESLGTPERFGEIYRKYFSPIYAYVAGRLGPDAAEDVVAEVFLAAFRARRNFDAALGQVRPWLYGIATNVLARHSREESRRYRTLAKMGGEVAAGGHEDRVAERLAAAGHGARLADALAGLPARDRDVLLLVAIGQLSYAEVAVALSIPEGTVGSRLYRVRRELAQALGGADPVADAGRPGPRGRSHGSHG
jgi:RNA polymerase sigma-70 factor (ECF subfamily)